MDKITRILSLYSQLLHGEVVDKVGFCFETECSMRSFDRDIEDLRLYLSDTFANCELVYDKRQGGYYFTNTIHTPLEKSEYLFMEKVLLASETLRKDEMNDILHHLAMNTENPRRMTDHTKQSMENYQEPTDTKPLLKLFGDLTAMIDNQQSIMLSGKNVAQYGKIKPCSISYHDKRMWLKALTLEKEQSVEIPIDTIDSFYIVK